MIDAKTRFNNYLALGPDISSNNLRPALRPPPLDQDPAIPALDPEKIPDGTYQQQS